MLTVNNRLPTHTWAILTLLASLSLPFGWSTAGAELYLAGQTGAVFPQQFDHRIGSGTTVGCACDLNLHTSWMIGVKVGYFPSYRSWLGVEVDIYRTTPQVKANPPNPPLGAHFEVTTAALNLVGRYPGETFEPYVGVGVGDFFSRTHATNASGSQTDTSDSSMGFNFLVGIRAFVSQHAAVFAEFKYNQARLHMDSFATSGQYTAQLAVIGVSWHF